MARKVSKWLSDKIDKKAYLYEKQGNYHRAAILYNISNKLDKKESEEWLRIASLEMKAERFKDAIKNIQKYLIEHPNSIKALLLLGIAFRGTKQTHKAIEVHLECLKLDKSNPWITYYLGQGYEDEGNIKTAITYFMKTIDSDKSFAKAYFKLGNLYMFEERYDLAINVFLEGLSLEKDNTFGWVNLALCYMKLEQMEAAKKVLFEAKKISDQPEILFAMGLCKIYQKSYNEAEEIIEKLDKENDRLLILSLKLKISAEKRDYEVIRDVLKSIKKKDRNAEYWYFKSIEEINRGKESKGIKTLRKALELNQDLKREAKKDHNFAVVRELVEFKHIVYKSFEEE